MLAKLLTLLHSKVAIAVVGAALVGSTGVAVAATQGKITLPGAASATHGASATHTPNSTAGAIHAHTASINGTLVGCSAGAGTICVKDTDGKTWQVRVNDSTQITGNHALTDKDLATLTGQRVEVQATAQDDGSYVAWKVTLIGPATTPDAKDHGNAPTVTPGQGTGGAQSQPVTESGTIATLGANGFTLTLANGSQRTVTTSATTTFVGMAHQLSDLKAHKHVSVQGTMQPYNSLTATRVEASA
jgi:hypothetical protein